MMFLRNYYLINFILNMFDGIYLIILEFKHFFPRLQKPHKIL